MSHTLIVAATAVKTKRKLLSGWILHFSRQRKTNKTRHCCGGTCKARASAVPPILNKAIRKGLTEKSDILAKTWRCEPNRYLREHSRQRD